MKIAYLSTFYPLRGGIAQFNASLYRELEKEHKIKAFTFKRQYPDILFPGNTQYVTSTDKAAIIPSTEILDSINPLSYYKTVKAICSYSPDILLMKYWMTFFAPSLGTVAKKLKKDCKIITILDNVIPHEKRFFDDFLTTYFLKQNHGFVVMSDTVKKDLLSFIPNAKYLKKEHPLYNHFGEKKGRKETLQHFGMEENKKTILFFGFIRDYKGLDVLINAFSQLDDSYQLLIAGECYGSFDKYQQLIKQSSLKNNISVFNKYIHDEQVTDFFSAADVCVLPYKSATQSGITSISYHFNVPIIATDVGGLKETIEHNKTGLIVEKAEPKFVADAIRNYFKNEEKIDFQKNIKTLKQQFSWNSFANDLMSFVNTLEKEQG